MTAISVTLPTDVAQLLRERLDTDDPLAVADALTEAIHLWSDARAAAERHAADFHAAIREGLDSGAGVPAEQVFTQLRASIAERQLRRDAA